jgi:hypothetical protein
MSWISLATSYFHESSSAPPISPPQIYFFVQNISNHSMPNLFSTKSYKIINESSKYHVCPFPYSPARWNLMGRSCHFTPSPYLCVFHVDSSKQKVQWSMATMKRLAAPDLGDLSKHAKFYHYMESQKFCLFQALPYF